MSPPSGPGGFGGRSIPIDSDGDGQPNTFSESFFDVFVMADMDENGSFETELFGTGVEGAIGFGPSPLSNASNQPLHLLVELEAPLLITAAEAGNGPFAGGVEGPNGGGYSPDPIFWGANVADDIEDPPASLNIVTIDPLTGFTTVDSSFVPAAPEPATLLLFSAAVLVAVVRRRV